MATLLKVLINLADIKSAGGVALRVGIQAVLSQCRTSTALGNRQHMTNMLDAGTTTRRAQ